MLLQPLQHLLQVGACLAPVGFLAAPACRLAACLLGQWLLGEGVEDSASTVGQEGVEGTTAGCRGAAITPVTTAALVCLPSTCCVSWPPCDTSLLLLTSTMSLKLQRKSAPMMGKATGASRKLQVNFLVQVCTVHVQRPQHLSGMPSVVMTCGE